MQAEPFALGRFSQAGAAPFVGVVQGDRVARLSDLLPASQDGAALSLFELLPDWNRNFEQLRQAVQARFQDVPQRGVDDLRAHAPLPETRQIFCTAANYRRHLLDMAVAVGTGPASPPTTAEQRRAAAEITLQEFERNGKPFVFMKPITAIAGPHDELCIPSSTQMLDWELELGVVIGEPAHEVSRERALDHVAGYMVVNDVSARDKMRRPDLPGLGVDWLSSKGSKGFLPTGPYFVPRQFIADQQRLAMQLKVNGDVMQDDSTSDMIFDVARQIEFLSSSVALLPGDLLCTGSPTGNGVIVGRYLQPDDLMEATIEGLGTQLVRCVGR